MHHNRQKQQIVLDNPELVLCENGDFKIKADLVEQYEIIDISPNNTPGSLSIRVRGGDK